MSRLKDLLMENGHRKCNRLWSNIGYFSSVALAVILLIAGLCVYQPVIEGSDANDMHVKSWKAFLPFVAMAYGSLLLLVVAIIEGRVRAIRSRSLLLRNQTLDELVAYLTECQEQEREEISASLHDTIGNLVAAVKMETEALNLEGDEESRERVDRLLDQLLNEVRGISTLLYPRMIGTLGLEDALQQMVERLESSELNINLSLEGNLQDLDKETSLCVLRIVQESIINVGRHANAHEVDAFLKRQNDSLTGGIDDDGDGWGCESEGMGLTLMRERIRKLGGRLRLGGSPKGGARVNFTISCSGE